MGKNKYSSKRYLRKTKKKRTHNKRKLKNIYGGASGESVFGQDLNEYHDMSKAYTVLYNILNATEAMHYELDFIQIQKLYLTLQYAINMKGVFVIVYIKNSNLLYFEPFYSRSWNSGPAELLLDKYDKYTDIAMKLRQEIDAYNSYRHKYARNPDTNVGIKDVLLDRCMIRQRKSMLDKYVKTDGTGTYRINLYKDLITQYLKDSARYNLNKLFILNLNDHPLIQKKIFDTSFLVSIDTSRNYSDLIFPHADAWIKFRSPEYSNEVGDHYKSIQIYIDKYTHEDFNIETNYDINISTRENKVVFRGSLTGCKPLSDKNSRLSLFKESKNLNSPVGSSAVTSAVHQDMLDIQLTGQAKHVIFNNYLYGTDIDEAMLDNQESMFGNDYIHVIPADVRKHFLDPVQLFIGYQYILSIDGYVSAWRLTYELLLGNIVFIKTNYTSWITEYLISGNNCYIIEDLNDCSRIFEHLSSNPHKKKQISMNATILGRKLLTKRCIYDCVKKNLDMVPSIYLSETHGYQHIY